MTDTVDAVATEVNPLEDKVMTLKFTVKEINSILNIIGNLPFIQAAGIVNAIQAQCAPQIDALQANDESQTAA